MNSFWDVIQYLLRRSRILLGRSLPSPLPYPELNNIVCLHMLDLMSLDCNVKKDAARILPRHFTTHPTLFCAGINVFAQAVSSEDIYVFASFVLVSPLLWFLEAANISSTIKVPQLYPLPFWWLILAPMLLHVYSWGIRGDLNMLLLLSSKNFFIPRPLQWDLFAFTVNIC